MLRVPLPLSVPPLRPPQPCRVPLRGRPRTGAALPAHAALLVLAAVLLAVPARATQAGDREGEEQPPLPADLVVPPAPARSPAEERATFALPPGFAIELVAAEPLVRDPVVAAFDAAGRLWVAEMPSYMPDVDGTGEAEPDGTVAVLADTDGDGRMDRRTVFLDGLVLPRAVAPARGGALVIAHPQVFWAIDEDGDGRADRRVTIETGIDGLHSPEHAINGLLWTLDGGYRCANAGVTYRWSDAPPGAGPRDPGAWVREATAGGGQWGLTKDDLGRVYFNTNSDPLFVDLIPSRYAIRNPNHGQAAGVKVRLVHDQRLWPARRTPGVNRGYHEGLLDEDFRLTRFTAACAPHVQRGDALGPAQGDVFVCEPAANLVKRYQLEESAGGGLRAVEAHAGREFLTSTDERFRPVNLLDGPDGALYVVDMYRGVIQHRLFVTSFLRAQVEARGLATPTGLGRIWRVVRTDAEPAPAPALAEASWTDVAAALAHPNGWVRDTAQRLVTEEGAGDAHALELVRAMLASEAPLGRLHALQALASIGGLRAEHLAHLLADPDPRVAVPAVRASEPVLARGDGPLVPQLVALARRGDARLAWQVLLSLGEACTRSGDEALLALAAADVSTAELRSAILSGLFERELAFLEALLADPAWAAEAPGRERFVHFLARCVAREGRTDRVARLVDLAAAEREPLWQRRALLDGALAGRPPGPDGEPSFLALAREPAGAATLLALGAEAGAEPGAEPGAETGAEPGEGSAVAESEPSTAQLAERARRLHASLLWPGRTDVEVPHVRPLDSAEIARFEAGRAIYARICISCHQASGLGEEGKAPPLRYSEWVLGDPDRLAALVLVGAEGPLRVKGRTWTGEMPAFVEPDENVAAVLTYVRREWGHGAEPVTPSAVARVRARVASRSRPWTEADLRTAFPPPPEASR